MGKERSRIGLWVTIVILLLMLGGSFLINLGLGALCRTTMGLDSGASDGLAVDQFPVFEETISYGDGKVKAVRIPLEGAIMRGRTQRLIGSEADMVESILSKIRAATIDEEVKAILLEVDSPGGAVTPSDEIYAALNRFKASDSERVILVFIRGLGASGAYYAAMAGDYIMAEPTAIVGSVGVIMQTMNMEGLGEKLGISSVTIASGANKDMLNPLKPVDPEHRALLQGLVNTMQERFASIVVDSRNLENRDLLDGRVFHASDAKEKQLIDGIGYWEDAVVKLEELLGVDDLCLIRYSKTSSFMESMLGAKTPEIPQFNAMQSPQMMSIWKP